MYKGVNLFPILKYHLYSLSRIKRIQLHDIVGLQKIIITTRAKSLLIILPEQKAFSVIRYKRKKARG